MWNYVLDICEIQNYMNYFYIYTRQCSELESTKLQSE
uniref:Uncharacterized protein n=1 Tax=Anguilla anguilla TaxID=7936 RepID=A0A0E9UUX7_ANGAN